MEWNGGRMRTNNWFSVVGGVSLFAFLLALLLLTLWHWAMGLVFVDRLSHATIRQWSRVFVNVDGSDSG